MVKKKEQEIEHIDFPDHYWVCGADLSLRCPGFCLLEVNKQDGKTVIKDIKLTSLNNKGKKNKTHGEILREIHTKFGDFTRYLVLFPDNTYFVREKMVMNQKVPSERDVAKVVGIMDFYLWKEWYEIYPVTVKKIITGNGKAEKQEVAACLEKYLGKQEYKYDDESDAAAVAISWLIQHGEIKE